MATWRITETEPPEDAAADAVLGTLAETIIWCKDHADPAHPESSLRTPELRPRVLERAYIAAVQDVLSCRRHPASQPKVPPADDLGGGRILVYGPNEELADGAAEAETGGYFDVHNCPPWDTWFGYVEYSDGLKGQAAHLFAWVPPVFLKSVDRGISVNPEACIQWFEDWVAPGPSKLVTTLRGVARGLTRA